MRQLLASRRFRRAAIQTSFILLVVLVVYGLVVTSQRNIVAQGIATGFGFLERTTGWPINFSVIEVSARSTYSRIIFAGLLNTMLVGFLTLFFASILGILLALFRVSSNTLMKIVGTTYVEVFRNVPVVLQVFFWYAVLTHLPGPKQAYNLWDIAMLSNRGIVLPGIPLVDGGLVYLALAIVAAGLWLWLSRERLSAVVRFGGALGGVGVIFVILAVLGHEAGTPILSLPELKGLRIAGGVTLKPEMTALVIGLVLFGAAYIGEIIRGGLISVDRGKLEAGRSLGLSTFQINRLILVPLALRASLPSLTNQYVWLMKATTVGLAVGFPDYFAVISTSINQSGQTLELLALLMGGFIVLNYSIAFVMNAINDRIKIKGRS
ncbi:ABC transporter permease subunit [Marinovum sp. 2_MG-2023]|uniref:ABC transporter permease subunit n=1 Tax=unclassified Marinovum TaxID=2647166 RepID=UPI0026E13C34|nr:MULTISPECIES: ABC transporter permease subunit [unclassified Marinovum]MDO6728992.1 ABC transporter permease subunit [Marinovum sp. 2_MG-2023]MDO6779381.1 ABC transporter permease subunit [Marinovum sp. 1_MG-2023]